MLAYFLGVWPGETAGHYIRATDGGNDADPRVTRPSPWASRYAPLSEERALAAAWGKKIPCLQPEGLAKVLHQDGWTLVSYWDRSGDPRYGSHSTFALSGLHTPQEALDLARSLFPAVFERFERYSGHPVSLHP